MTNKAIRNLHYAFLGLLTGLVVCIVLRPQGLWANDGFSYYGGLGATVIPYALSYLVFGVFLVRATDSLDNISNYAVLKWLLRIGVICLFGLAVIPHNIRPYDHIHVAFGATLFFIEFMASIWLGWRLKQPASWALLMLMLVGGLFSLYYLPLKQGFLLEGQIVFQLAFWAILVQAAKTLPVRANSTQLRHPI